MSHKWDTRYLKLAREVATWSKDRSTQVGAVIILEGNTPGPYGFNGFPRAVDDDADERHARPLKYEWTEHAERNAIFHAARVGVRLEGATIYVTHFPCSDCSRAIIQTGICEIVVDEKSKGDPDFAKRWGEIQTQEEMLKEASVTWRFAKVED